jgi:outer membrane cobalamin receptor
MRKWRIEDSEELYNITGWGTSYFGINDKGHVVVTPRKDGVEVDLKELVDELQLRDVAAPMLVRFPDILDNRIEKIANCFKQASDELFCNLVDADGYYFTHFLQDKAKTAYGGAELKYGYKDWFDASLKGTFYSWKTDNENEELYLVTKPKFELNFYAEAKVFEGLKVNLGYEYVQRKEYVIEEGNSSRDFGLGNISNLSVGASYTFLKDLSVFGRVNNLLNKQYYYEYGYPAEKLNVLTGLSLAF